MFHMKQAIVSQNATEKLKRFFPWVYDNELLKPPRRIEPGEVVQVASPTGEFLGIGYMNPLSRITIRMLDIQDRPIDRSFLEERVMAANRLRLPLRGKTNACRVIHAEADLLPGLVVDDYDGCLSIQINTAGMEVLRKDVLDVLHEVFHPRGIYEKSDAAVREKEGLATYTGLLHGDIPSEIRIVEESVHFVVRLQESQKTGFYLDQRRNRSLVARYVSPGDRVLDVFSNTGGFGIYAARQGAGAVRLVDVSQSALRVAMENVNLNGLTGVETIKMDAFDYLVAATERGDRYHLIVLDPPSFTKTVQGRRGALKGFSRLVASSIELLQPQGYLAVFSCSFHVSMEDLKEVVQSSAFKAGVSLRVVEHLYQDIDHPYLIHIPQSLYLKGLLMQVI